MSINFGQIIMDAQRLANRLKELDTSSNALIIEAESNNRALESMRQFQDDMDSLNKLARNKTNSDMVNRINQQNPSMREIRQENRELKALLEDQQRTMELIMHKYREQLQHKIFESRLNFKELSNDKVEEDLRRKSEKIYEMAAVMQKAASIDDSAILKEIEENSRLKIENQTLREILRTAQEYGSLAPTYENNLGNNVSMCSNTTTSASSNILNSSNLVTAIHSPSGKDIAIQTEVTTISSSTAQMASVVKIDSDDEDSSSLEDTIKVVNGSFTVNLPNHSIESNSKLDTTSPKISKLSVDSKKEINLNVTNGDDCVTSEMESEKVFS